MILHRLNWMPKPATIFTFVSFYLLSLSFVFAQSTQPKALFEQVIVEQTPLSTLQAQILDYVQKDTATIRFAVVKINPALLLEEKAINLNLFPNENFTTITNKIDQRGEQDFSWHGNAPRHLSNILLTVYKEAIAGYIIIDDDYFNVRSIGNGLHVLIQVDPRKSARCGTGAASTSNASSRDNNTTFVRSEIFKSSTTNNLAKTMSNTIIKVLVAYTTAAKNLAGGENGITAIINSAKDAANISYTNSAVAIALEIADTEEVNYSESTEFFTKTLRYCGQIADRSVMLIDFQTGTGAMSAIPDLRGLYGGDVAVLLVAPDFLPGNANGQAFDISVPVDEAFCVVNYNQAAAAGAWTFTHEIGHLQGCRHQTNAGEAPDPCNEPYSYGHGNRFFVGSNDFGTMMATGFTRIQYWSGPDVYYQGVPTGNTTTANNALVLTQRAATVANFVEELSGTISSNKTISGIASLAANVTVSSGVTLTMAATAQVFARDGVSLTINNGATLIINAGAKFKFGSGASIIVNGKITADSNDPNKRITFTGITATPGFWNGITINSGNGSNISTLRRCDVTYATTGITIIYTGQANTVTIDKCRPSNNSSKGIYVNGNAWSSAYAHPTLSNNYIHHNSSSGITVGNYAKPIITGNQIEYNSAYGIEATSSYTGEASFNRVANNSFQGMLFYSSSHAQVHRNTVEANGSGGLYIFSNSNVTASGGGTSKGRNEITGNGGNGVYANTSSPNFGFSYDGYNWMQNNTNYEAQQVGSGYQVLAENCYWGGGAPAPSEISGNVDYSPYTTTLPNPVGWGQSDTYDPSLRIWRQDSIIVAQPFAEVHFAKYVPAIASQAKAANESLPNVTADLQTVINVGLATGDWSPASALITDLHRELQDARIPALDFALVNTYASDSKVAAFIRKMLALVLMEKDLVDNNTSIALAKLTAFRQSNSANAAELLANAGLIHLYRQNDIAAAQNVLAQLQTMAQNGDAIAAEHVKAFGRILQDYQDHQANTDLAKPVITPSQALTKLPANSALAQNYPNPFNPETKIRFHLRERQQVRLLIFDLNGKRVRTLVEGELPAGAQTMLWDGRDQQGQTVASGTYFYELVAGDKIERKKMTLVR